MQYCARCGQPIGEGMSFCSACGAPTEPEPTKVATGEAAPPPIAIAEGDASEVPSGQVQTRGVLLWTGAAVAGLVLVALVLLGLNALGIFSTPSGAVSAFYQAQTNGDSEALRAAVTKQLWDDVGPQLAGMMPEGMTKDFKIAVNGDKATAVQQGPTWSMTLDLTKDGKWLVSRITEVRTDTSQKDYRAPDVVITAKQLPASERIVLSEGQPGTRELLTQTTFINGASTSKKELDGKVINQSVAARVVQGSGPAAIGDVVHVSFDPSKQQFTQEFTISTGFTSFIPGSSSKAGDVFNFYIILPTGEIAQFKDRTWDGTYDPEAFHFLGAPYAKTVAATWLPGQVAHLGFKDAVKDAWPKGRYVLGHTVNGGTPGGWATCDLSQ